MAADRENVPPVQFEVRILQRGDEFKVVRMKKSSDARQHYLNDGWEFHLPIFATEQEAAPRLEELKKQHDRMKEIERLKRGEG